VKRTELQPADELTETLLTEILKHGKFGDEKRVAVMVNNLGATTEMELAIVAAIQCSFLKVRDLRWSEHTPEHSSHHLIW